MDIYTIINNKWAQMSAVGICACAGGFGIGYYVAKRRYGYFEMESEQLDNTDVEPPHAIFDQLPDRIVTETEPDLPVEFEDSAPVVPFNYTDVSTDISEDEGEDEPDEEDSEDDEDISVEPFDEDEVEVNTVRNIFVSEGIDSDWDYEKELANRDSTHPYILHQDEYMNDEMGFTQSTLTYYDGDQILADEQDVPVYNHERVVGELKFGHGSNDPNVVYVRNENARAEYEILLFSGYFEREVLGLEADAEIDHEIKHSQSSLRFRSNE